LGSIYSVPNFKKFLILVFEPTEHNSVGWTGENGLFICAPAESRSQAIEMAKELTEKSGWNLNDCWR
jgi:hypothetical protein